MATTREKMKNTKEERRELNLEKEESIYLTIELNYLSMS